MRGVVRAGDKDVVKVDEDEGQARQHPVHHPLEGRASVVESEGHLHELEQSKGRDDGGLGDVIREHLHLVVTLDEVQGGENVGASHVVGEVPDVGHGVKVPLLCQNPETGHLWIALSPISFYFSL